MGVGTLIGFLILIALILFFTCMLIYYKKRKSTIGIILSLCLLICLLSFFFMNKIDEVTISKNDVRQDLNKINIELNTNFIIKENTVSGFPERYQKTEIEISKSEVERIINEIQNSENFKHDSNNISLHLTFEGQIQNIKYPKYYSRELYKEIENIPTRILLTVYEGKGLLEYQKMED